MREGHILYRAEISRNTLEVLGQVFSYAAMLKHEGMPVPFVATANDGQITVFVVPEDIDKYVNWWAIEERDYGSVLKLNYIFGELREKCLLFHKPIKFEESFFAELLETLTGFYKQKYKLDEVKQNLSWVLIEDFRGFVYTLGTEIETVRDLVIEFAKRRLSRAGEARPTVIRGEE